MNEKIWNLVQRLKALKEKGTRVFELWRHLQEARAKTKWAEYEAWSMKQRLTLAEHNLELSNNALAIASRADPLAAAEQLLAEASEILSSPMRNSYEARSWCAEYMAYKFRRHRANYES